MPNRSYPMQILCVRVPDWLNPIIPSTDTGLEIPPTNTASVRERLPRGVDILPPLLPGASKLDHRNYVTNYGPECRATQRCTGADINRERGRTSTGEGRGHQQEKSEDINRRRKRTSTVEERGHQQEKREDINRRRERTSTGEEREDLNRRRERTSTGEERGHQQGKREDINRRRERTSTAETRGHQQEKREDINRRNERTSTGEERGHQQEKREDINRRRERTSTGEEREDLNRRRERTSTGEERGHQQEKREDINRRRERTSTGEERGHQQEKREDINRRRERTSTGDKHTTNRRGMCTNKGHQKANIVSSQCSSWINSQLSSSWDQHQASLRPVGSGRSFLCGTSIAIPGRLLAAAVLRDLRHPGLHMFGPCELGDIQTRGKMKQRPGKSSSARDRHRWMITETPEPSTSAEPGPELPALLAEDGACVIALEPGQMLTFNGKVSLTCLYGGVRVLGLLINNNQTTYQVFSPHTHSPLTVEAMPIKKSSKTRKEIRMEARALLRGYLSLDCRRAIMKSFKSSSSILLLERTEDAATNFILSHPDYANLFSTKAKERSPSIDNAVLYSIGVENREPNTGIKMSDKCISAVQQLIHACIEEDHGCPIILVCGPKNVGKSTFNRFLINQLLNHIPCVGYLECDLGQTEFTPPGCVSLMYLTKPVLGPPFTHQREAQKMVYFGETTCEQDMERFIESVKYVITSYKREQPLIINTMGWVKGVGLLLLIDLIRLLSPSHIVQMGAKGSDDMDPLTPKYIHDSPGFLTKNSSRAQSKERRLDLSDQEQDYAGSPLYTASVGHMLHSIESDFSGAGEAGNVRCHSGILRDLAMMGYLAKLQQLDSEQVVPLNSLLPYEVPFSAVALRVIHSDVTPSHIMYSINASWVGLCYILDDLNSENDGPVLLTQTPVCDCLGFGIVRGVDMERKVYHLLTPVPPETLRIVNCLLVGNISIPHSVFKNQRGFKGEIPYVTSEYDFRISGAGKMKKNKQLKRREHQ
ncbi:polynucleotide 5'-hydroxyl-kinase NOL9 [Pelodytes ibericus]